MLKIVINTWLTILRYIKALWHKRDIWRRPNVSCINFAMHNMLFAVTDLTKRLKDKNHFGVVLDIQNYSGLR